ncbi:MAG: hypothetical protein KatS3mg049_0695 [Caldilinea sp.]|nr:MAG: hypothetical protein KatS3mg049_0695 [Caldilinea sp.]
MRGTASDRGFTWNCGRLFYSVFRIARSTAIFIILVGSGFFQTKFSSIDLTIPLKFHRPDPLISPQR